MRRRLLIITKDPEFDMRGEVVMGQCEPFTSGWSMFLIYPDGRKESLVTGTYSDLRKIQEGCIGLEDPAAVRKRVPFPVSLGEIRLALLVQGPSA